MLTLRAIQFDVHIRGGVTDTGILILRKAYIAAGEMYK
jgi:hypothetical protein